MTKPLLIYDGACGFCSYWVQYWKKLTGDAVIYEPYQRAARRYPQIPAREFVNAVQYVAPDGTITRAAKATFQTLSHAPGKNVWLSLYQKLPGFAVLTEWMYAFIAKRRPFFYLISLLLWGKDHEPPCYDLVSWFFLRGMGFIFLAAFLSFAVQATGLIGSDGILPLQHFINLVRDHTHAGRYFMLPTLFWINASDTAILSVCWLGVAFSLSLIFNILPRLSLLCLYIFYLSLMYAGQSFMTYQWDIFLVETGFLSLVLSIAPGYGIFLLRWLIFRFMFMSGVVKLFSGDPNWWNLSALSYHFLTQPLPTPLAWYAAQLPAAVLKFCTGMVFFMQLVLPLFVFFPRRMRFLAAYDFLLLEFIILLTGNYNFFNLQTMLMSLLLFDDAALRGVIPERWLPQVKNAREPSRDVRQIAAALSILIVFCSVVQMDMYFRGKLPAFAVAVERVVQPLGIVNTYGLFAVMTTKREEIIIEGSDDGKQWKEYGFLDKPGDVKRAPLWCFPHQPRLDWQMWFASLEPADQVPIWFVNFMQRILENTPPVMALLGDNPFPDKPPRYVRAELYDYTYASPEEKSQGIWWRRQFVRHYFPQASLKH